MPGQGIKIIHLKSFFFCLVTGQIALGTSASTVTGLQLSLYAALLYTVHSATYLSETAVFMFCGLAEPTCTQDRERHKVEGRFNNK